MTRPRVLVLCTTHRDRRELAAWADRFEFHFHDYASLALEELVCEEPPAGLAIDDPREEVERIVARFGGAIDAVISTDDYPGSLLAAVVAARLGLPGVAVKANLACQDKFRTREIQRSIMPEVVPPFALWGGRGAPPRIPFPVFVKPVKSFFSVGAYRVDSHAQLMDVAHRAQLPDAFFGSFDLLAKQHCGQGISRPTVLVEGLLAGAQYTYEGFVARGEVYAMGVTDSIMFPGTISFQRFEYPSGLPQGVQARMHDAAARMMRAIGFDAGLFNIEFMYDPATDALRIIEVNPRMASQFADLYEKVDGTNTYAVLLDLALGRVPAVRRREGRHATAASCVLRTFENADVIDVPSEQQVARAQSLHPDMRIEIFAERGQRLSQQMQDGRSYRYGILSIGGRDREDILAVLRESERRLPFAFAPLPSAASRGTLSVAR